MALTKYYQKLELEYFISPVDELQNGNFGFHTFGPFRKLTPHCAAATGAKVFVYMTYIKIFFMYTAPGLYAPFENSPSWIKPLRCL